MKNIKEWRPGKFVLKKGKLQATTDQNQIASSSRFIADIQASVYQRIINDYAKNHLLDLGCGNVPLYGVYKDKVKSVTCIDWGNSVLDLSHIDLEADLNQRLEVSSSSFDTVLLTDVLEHIEKPDLLFSEISRILKSGGYLLLTVPFFYPIHGEPYDFHRYTEYKLKSMCDENSLEIIELSPYAGLIEINLHFINYISSFSRYFSVFVYWLSKGFISLPYMKKISKKTSKRFPLGYTLVAKKCPS